MNGACSQGDPVEQGRAVQVHELPEKLLVEIHGRFGVAANGELHARIEDEAGIAQAQHRLNPYVENRVISVVLQDQGLAGNGRGAANVALAEVSTDRHKIAGMITEGGADLRLLRGARRYRRAEESCIHLVDGGIFKDRSGAEIAAHVEPGEDRLAFLS